MTTRFTDDIKNNIEESDFVVRRWKWGSIQLFILFAIVFVTIYLTAVIMYDIGNEVFFFVILTFAFGALCWFIITLAARNRDLVMATEFQNTLLASAAQLGTRFCFITKRDGSIAYIDPGFQKLFQAFMHSGNPTIEGFLMYAEVGEETRAKVQDIMKQNKSDRLQLTFKGGDGEHLPMMITIDLLTRPKGYFLFRGRDFIEKRNTSVEKPVPENPTANSTSAMLLARALFVLPEGILVTDKEGVITYVNHTLEEWLGYGTGEMLVTPLKLSQICHRYASKEVGFALFDDYDGDITLQRKDHTLISLKIRQTLVRHNGEVLGVSAVISLQEMAKK